jgi:hypothetical protein
LSRRRKRWPERVFDSILAAGQDGAMSSRCPVFVQILAGLDPTEFARCAQPFASARAPRGPSAYEHFLALCLHQLTQRESLRDLVTCLAARAGRGYHLGFRQRLTRSGLAYANAHRDWRIFAAVAALLMRRAQRLLGTAAPRADAPAVVMALDASLIELSLALFPWARRQPTEASVKLHTLFEVRRQVPVWNAVSEARVPDQKALGWIPIQPGAFYVLDRGYLDFSRLAPLHAAGAFFVVRSKCHVRFRVTASRPVDKATGLRCDQTIVLTTRWSRRHVDFPLRRVRLRDAERQLTLVLLTNDFTLPAAQIAELYRRRWQVELFFRWIKGHLRLRHFLGRSPNAVRSQVWAAICAYLLVFIARQRLGARQSLYEMLQIVSVSAFEQVPLAELLAEADAQEAPNHSDNQLSFNDL